MPATPIKRIDLGAGSSKRVANQDFSHRRLEDIDGKQVRYEGCTFFACIIERGYFHEAKFVKCRFIGTRFVNTILRSATFDACDFSYADFNRCVIPVPQILANLPDQPNVRWELLHNLRANARSLGDSQHEADIIWREIDTELEHWRAVSARRSGYYQKYTKLDRLLARTKRWRLLIERYVWGHGESLWRLALSTFTFLVALSIFRTIGKLPSGDSMSVGSIINEWIESFWHVTYLFIDLPNVNQSEVAASLITSTLAVALRYISIGLAVPILYKYIAKR
jgi:hypothetical protein